MLEVDRVTKILRFIKCFSLSEKLKKDFKLIFGGENPKICGLDILKKYKIKSDRFLFINGSNEDLKYYYKNVRLCVYPSRYEGFGIPLIESMRMGYGKLRAKERTKGNWWRRFVLF